MNQESKLKYLNDWNILSFCGRMSKDGSYFFFSWSILIINLPKLNSISVDAASSGNPGLMEYQGVDTNTKEILFKMGPFNNATNNIGEFLALVHGIAILEKKSDKKIIYSDSITAMSWVRKKHCQTKLKRNEKNEEVFVLVERAIKWLKEYNYSIIIKKWDTKNWGEIPADFGRK